MGVDSSEGHVEKREKSAVAPFIRSFFDLRVKKKSMHARGPLLIVAKEHKVHFQRGLVGYDAVTSAYLNSLTGAIKNPNPAWAERVAPPAANKENRTGLRRCGIRLCHTKQISQT